MVIDPATLAPRDVYFLTISVLVPRPIALVSSISADGIHNVAPFSFFGGISTNPPMVGISVGSRRAGPKDTVTNIQAAGEFVINTVDESIAEAMNTTSADFPPDVDEFVVAGLTPVAGERVAAPRVREAPVSMECRLDRVIELGHGPSYFVIGEVVLFHVRDALVKDGRVDIEAYHPVGRLGGTQYCRVRDVFELPRLDWKELLPDRAAREG